MGKSGDDAVGILILAFITLSLCIAVVLLGLAFLILVALLFLWWVLTYWLLRLINDVLTDNLVTESEGLLALVLPPVFWSILVGLLFPRPWIGLLALYLGLSTGRTWLYLLTGTGLISLGFGFLALLMLDDGDQGHSLTQNEAGVLELPPGSYRAEGDELYWEVLKEGVLLGEDI